MGGEYHVAKVASKRGLGREEKASLQGRKEGTGKSPKPIKLEE